MLTQGATKPVRAAVGEVLGAGGGAAQREGGETVASVSGEDESGGAPPDGGPARALVCQIAALGNAALADGQVEVQVASAVFAEQGLDVYPSFATMLRETFAAPVERLDFADAGAVERINTWVSETTEGAIPRLVSELDPNDVLVLANAMRFRGDWAQPFDPERTEPAPFHLRSGDTVEVPTMHAQELRARYRETERSAHLAQVGTLGRTDASRRRFDGRAVTWRRSHRTGVRPLNGREPTRASLPAGHHAVSAGNTSPASVGLTLRACSRASHWIRQTPVPENPPHPTSIRVFLARW